MASPATSDAASPSSAARASHIDSRIVRTAPGQPVGGWLLVTSVTAIAKPGSRSGRSGRRRPTTDTTAPRSGRACPRVCVSPSSTTGATTSPAAPPTETCDRTAVARTDGRLPISPEWRVVAEVMRATPVTCSPAASRSMAGRVVVRCATTALAPTITPHIRSRLNTRSPGMRSPTRQATPASPANPAARTAAGSVARSHQASAPAAQALRPSTSSGCRGHLILLRPVPAPAVRRTCSDRSPALPATAPRWQSHPPLADGSGSVRRAPVPRQATAATAPQWRY